MRITFNGDEFLTTAGIDMSELGAELSDNIADVRDAFEGLRITDDGLDYVDIDPAEARELITDTAKDLCDGVCQFAAYAKAYEEALRARGIDFKKLVDPNKFKAFVSRIRRSLEKSVYELSESDAANAAN